MVTKEMLPAELLKIIDKNKHKNNHILAIYHNGSKMHNLSTQQSDNDYYVLLLPSKQDIIENKKISKQIMTDNFDVFIIDLLHFSNLLMKSSPKVFELLYQEPIYIDDFYDTNLFDFFRHQRDNLLVGLNPNRLLKALLGSNMSDLYKYKKDIAKGKDFRYRAIKSVIDSELCMNELNDLINNHTLANSYAFVDGEQRNLLLALKKNAQKCLVSETNQLYYQQVIENNINKSKQLINNPNIIDTFATLHDNIGKDLYDELINHVYHLMKQL